MFRAAWIVFLAGAFLAATGFWWLWTGLDIVQLEKGWSAVIGGATMFSAGCIVAAIAAVLFRLESIAASLRRPAPRRRPAATPRADAPPAPAKNPATNPARSSLRRTRAAPSSNSMFPAPRPI
jgi:hypothetical protein